MKIAFASRTGNVESIVDKLGFDDVLKIDDGTESVSEDYILFTYTDGYGDVPSEVADFVANNSSNIKGVVVSGDTSYGDAFCGAGDAIAEEYNVPVLYKVENEGTDERYLPDGYVKKPATNDLLTLLEALREKVNKLEQPHKKIYGWLNNKNCPLGQTIRKITVDSQLKLSTDTYDGLLDPNDHMGHFMDYYQLRG